MLTEPAAPRNREAGQGSSDRGDELHPWRVGLPLELRDSSERVERDTPDREPESPRCDSMRDFMEQHGAKEPKGRHQTVEPQDRTGSAWQAAGELPVSEDRRHEGERQEPAPVEAERYPENPADGQKAGDSFDPHREAEGVGQARDPAMTAPVIGVHGGSIVRRA